MTKHAQDRRQQRCIPPMVEDLLMKFGTTVYLGGGCTKLFFDKRARRKVQAYAGPIAAKLNEHLDAYLVLSQSDDPITVAHLYERIQRH